MKKKYFAALLLFILTVIIVLFSFKKEIKYNKYATIEIEKKEYNFGTIHQNSKVKFIIKNISNNPFYILNVTSSEKTNFLDTKIKKIIDTNNYTFIGGEVIAHNIGNYYNSINIESNSKVKIKLVIKGYVVAP